MRKRGDRMKLLSFVLRLAIVASFLINAHAAEKVVIPWDVKALSVAPRVYDDPQHSTSDVKAIFYEGLPWKGHPTRVFAYYGLPKMDASKKVPAMVLVHGGGGSAYLPWVRLWVKRGYAAIAMDTCGAIGGEWNAQVHPRHEYSGPPGWGGFDQITEPINCARTSGAFTRPKITGPAMTAIPTPAKNNFLPELSLFGMSSVMMRTIRFFRSAPVTPDTQVSGDSTHNLQVSKMLSA